MKQKIGTFLIVMMALSAVLGLVAAAGRTPEATVPETTDVSSAPTKTTVQTDPQTLPQTETEPTSQPTQEPAAPQSSSMHARVERILEGGDLKKTAVTRRTEESGLTRTEGTEGKPDGSAVYALADLAQERKMNPISALWLLESEGVLERKSLSWELDAGAFEAPAGKAQTYAYTAEGARQLLNDLLGLSGKISDGLALETAILGPEQAVEPDQVFHSETENCRYAYFSCVSDRTTHILCFYLRADAAGEKIADVEFQLLSVRHADGSPETLGQLDGDCAKQAAALMAAAELVMTGSTRAAEGKIPEAYSVGPMCAALERFTISAEGEWGTLTNYRLRAE